MTFWFKKYIIIITETNQISLQVSSAWLMEASLSSLRLLLWFFELSVGPSTSEGAPAKALAMLFPGLTWPVQPCPNQEALEVVFAEWGLDSLGRGANKAQDSSEEITPPPWVLPVLGCLPLCCCSIRSPSTPPKVASA